jgi:hypothetical protein
LALFDSVWDFGSDWIFNPDDADARHVVHYLFLVFPVWFAFDMNLASNGVKITGEILKNLLFKCGISGVQPKYICPT